MGSESADSAFMFIIMLEIQIIFLVYKILQAFIYKQNLSAGHNVIDSYPKTFFLLYVYELVPLQSCRGKLCMGMIMNDDGVRCGKEQQVVGLFYAVPL